MGLYANRALIELIYKVGDKLKEKKNGKREALKEKDKKLNKNAYSTTDV